MSNSVCGCPNNCKFDCTVFAIVASIILGIIAAFLQVTCTIALGPVIYGVVFGIAVLFLPVTLAVSSNARSSGTGGCMCNILPVLLTGILGTILIAALLLTVAVLTDGVLGAIFTGLLVAFFSLIITSTACFIKCLTRCDE